MGDNGGVVFKAPMRRYIISVMRAGTDTKDCLRNEFAYFYGQSNGSMEMNPQLVVGNVNCGVASQKCRQWNG